MAVSKILKLGFRTDTDKTCVINIDEVADGLDDSEVKAAMDAMIATGAVSSSSGVIITRSFAKLVTTEDTEIIMA